MAYIIQKRGWIFIPKVELQKYLMIEIRVEYFRFGPVLDQNKQPNQNFFLSFWTEPNWKPIQTD
jgi:hypothetical protein